MVIDMEVWSMEYGVRSMDTKDEAVLLAELLAQSMMSERRQWCGEPNPHVPCSVSVSVCVCPLCPSDVPRGNFDTIYHPSSGCAGFQQMNRRECTDIDN